MLDTAGAYVAPDVCRGLLILVTNTPRLHGYATRALFRMAAAHGERLEHSVATCAVWCIGEARRVAFCRLLSDCF